jgi:hypothetical protein
MPIPGDHVRNLQEASLLILFVVFSKGVSERSAENISVYKNFSVDVFIVLISVISSSYLTQISEKNCVKTCISTIKKISKEMEIMPENRILNNVNRTHTPALPFECRIRTD